MANDGWRFKASGAAAALACRETFRDLLQRSCTIDSDLAAAELVYVELVGNVMRHAAGRVEIVLDWRDGYAQLCVRDWGPGFYHHFGLPDSFSETGRGMFIVNHLCRSLEVECAPDGCVVRAELPVRLAA